MALRHAQHDPADDDAPSKTQRKSESHALQKLGERLVELDPGKVERIELPSPLDKAIAEMRRIKAHEGRRRQLQFIGRLMRELPPDESERIRAALDALDRPNREETLRLHRLEQWRDALIEDESAQSTWIAAYPACDTQQLRSLIRAARAQRTDPSSRAARAYRELFQWLRQVSESVEDPRHD